MNTLPKRLEYTVSYDYLEAGTFVVLGALASKEYIDIHNACIPDLNAFLERVHATGVCTEDR